jgi:hypothetical protein
LLHVAVHFEPESRSRIGSLLERKTGANAVEADEQRDAVANASAADVHDVAGKGTVADGQIPEAENAARKAAVVGESTVVTVGVVFSSL